MRTSLYSILCIVIRLGAVFLAVDVVATLPFAWQSIDTSQLGSGFGGMFLGFAGAMLGLAALLWIYPGVLARIAAGNASTQVFESPISAEEVQRIALAVLGVAFAMYGIVDTVAIGLRLLVSMRMSHAGFGGLVPQEIGRLVAALVKIALGVGLAFGSQGVVGILRQFRERGAALHPDHEPRGTEEADRSAQDTSG